MHFKLPVTFHLNYTPNHFTKLCLESDISADMAQLCSPGGFNKALIEDALTLSSLSFLLRILQLEPQYLF